MDSQRDRTTIQLPPTSAPLQPRRNPRFSSTGRIVFSVLMFVLGVIIGVAGILLYALSISSDGRVIITPLPSNGGDIVIQVGPAYLTHLVASDLQSSGMPGTITNVNVSMTQSERMTITGDDQFSVLGVGITRQFTVVVQPFVRDCLLQMHVLHADTQGIPVTGFVQNFEGQINQQLQTRPTNLPKGFVYCTIAIRTDPKGLFVTYSATPV